MREERRQFTSDVRFDDHLALYGTVTGSASVGRRGWLLLYGTVIGDVIVEAGGTANLVGTVGGHVINRGGQVTVAGAVGGDVRHEAGQTMIAASAIIAHGRTAVPAEAPPPRHPWRWRQQRPDDAEHA